MDIIKRSATDMGEPGVDSKYGWGQINFSRAFEPVGNVKLPPEEDDTGQGDVASETDDADSGFDTRNLTVGGTISGLLQANPYFSNIQVVDKYGRNYQMDLRACAIRRHSVTPVDSILSRLSGKATESIQSDTENIKLTTHFLLPNDFEIWKDHGEHADGLEPGLLIQGASMVGQLFSLGVNSRPEDHTVPIVPASANHGAQFFASEAFRTSWMGYTQRGLHSNFAYATRLGRYWGLAFSSVDDGTRHGSRSDSGAFYFGKQSSRWAVKGRVGLLLEDGNLQGGSADGALSVESSDTVSGSLTARIALSTGWTLLGSYTEGVTNVTDRRNSLLDNFSVLHNDTWAMGLVGNSILRQKDTIGFAVAQPMRTRSGSVNVSIPYAGYPDGALQYYRDRVSLVPTGRENALEFFYRTRLGRRTVLTGNLVHRLQPSHRAHSTSQTSLVLVLQGSF